MAKIARTGKKINVFAVQEQQVTLQTGNAVYVWRRGGNLRRHLVAICSVGTVFMNGARLRYTVYCQCLFCFINLSFIIILNIQVSQIGFSIV